MRTYSSKLLLFAVAIASIFLFFACSSKQGSIFEPGTEPEPSLESSSSNPLQGNDLSSSSAIVSSSSSIVGVSSSAGGSSSSVNSSSSATPSSSSALSSSSVNSSNSATSSSSSARSSSSLRSSSSATTASTSSSSVAAVPLPIGPLSCTREGLISAVNSYLAAIAAGDYTKMPLATGAKYYENDHDAKQKYSGGKMTYDKEVPFGEGLWKTPLVVDFHRNLIDVTECATFTEIIIANSDPQYVLGARLDVKDGKISNVTLVVTQKGDWGFNANNYLRYSKGEDWSELPATTANRRSREQLQSDGYAYFKYFTDKSAPAPWATPCARLEGGAYTGDGKNSSCNVGIPDGTSITPLSYLADVDYGMVVVFMYFGGADSHWFRILPAGYRYIHTLTAMKQSDYQAPR